MFIYIYYSTSNNKPSGPIHPLYSVKYYISKKRLQYYFIGFIYLNCSTFDVLHMPKCPKTQYSKFKTSPKLFIPVKILDIKKISASMRENENTFALF